MASRSMTPSKAFSAPIGTCRATGLASSLAAMDSKARKKSAPTLSILFTRQIRGTPYRSACRQTVSDWGSTPSLPSKTTTAPSSTRRLRSTSAVKSTCPGVSIRLMVWSFQVKLTAAEKMVMPRSCSCSSKSVLVVAKSTSPGAWVAPV